MGRPLVHTALFMSAFISVDFLVFVGWVLCEFALTWMAFVLVRFLHIQRLPGLLGQVIQHTAQSVFFFSTLWCALCLDISTLPRTALFLEMLVLLLKMHSFVHYHCMEAASPPVPSASHFMMFLIFPTLIYQPEYPRTKKIDWSFFLAKFMMCFGSIFVLYVMATEHIEPVLEASTEISPFACVARLIVPFIIGYLFIWFIIFDNICNGLAEITRFGPREFYQDWWNSTTYSEYNRRWNRPVHEWLFKYVFAEFQTRYHMSKFKAGLVTFFFSAVLHEMFFIVVFRITRLYWFMLMMMQLPLIYMGSGVKGKQLGNYIIWEGLCIGIPMQVVLYVRESYGAESLFFTLHVPCLIIAGSAAAIGGLFIFLSKHAAQANK
eukprot:TRINITY_DN8607_c0_g1_i1.p1 TRINITY_DN8607_c0_g1~~TRINITY_DN8607_c0_g1_i1.p1  ORF type:complete len:409 (-),score=96.53 TRINITY_DN8607_c0_g1_i1:90-1223(-)